ncbi:MAG: farnesyl diphosphate synthase [Betaproteobacteria bacterium]
MPDRAFADWTRERQQRIEQVLDGLLPSAEAPGSPRLAAAMRYATLGGGKRMRPLLAYAAAELAGGARDDVDRCAAAVEFIHAYSLIHDDLPCMDDDALRRGKPTCHIAFGVATALLAGDALQSLAFATLAGARRMSLNGCRLLADAAGHAGMAGGQQLDLDATGAALDVGALNTLHALKTGALIRAAVRLGAACGRTLDGHEARALDAYAAAAGLAFQVVDDVLDVEGSDATLGKTAGKDAVQNKSTFVTLLGLEPARRRSQALHAEAVAALEPLGAAGGRLVQLADWIASRKS